MVAAVETDESRIFATERPEPALWKLYVIRSLLTGPGLVVVLPLLFFRYRTLRYRLDDEGVHMKVGVLFRREVNLTYARIQDIHVRSGFIQRWLGLADLLIQTASGSAGAELTIEGFHNTEEIRDFLYRRMRGAKEGPSPGGEPSLDAEATRLLLEIRDELRATREHLSPNSDV